MLTSLIIDKDPTGKYQVADIMDQNYENHYNQS